MNYNEYQSCIEACLKCVAACNHCASSCLKEQDVAMMARCVQLDMECAAICAATAQLMSMGSQYALQLVSICANICRECTDECGMHHNDHCKRCAEACLSCADACAALQDAA
jgi:hypothetical protein